MIGTKHQLRFGTRASRLARWQSHHIAEKLQQLHPQIDCTEVVISTAGDRDRVTPLPEIGGKGLFTEALESALLAGTIDIAVHSLKDLPIEPPGGLVLGAICCRADPRDVLIARASVTIDTIHSGARVGTSSNRRIAQLKAARPDVDIVPVRGNVDTRVRKVLNGDYDAVVIAAAGVERLDLQKAVSEYLSIDRMTPAPGQGALAVQCRADDTAVLTFLAAIDESAVRAATTAERSFLAALGGGCSAPVAAHATPGPETGTLVLKGFVGALDGSRAIRVDGSGPASDAAGLGTRLAREALDRGAAALVE